MKLFCVQNVNLTLQIKENLIKYTLSLYFCPMNLKHIFFDLDQTLWDFDLNSELAFQKCFENQNIQLDFAAFIKTYEPINESYWKLYAEGKVTKEQLKYARLRDTFTILHYEITDEAIDVLAESYLEILPHFNHLHHGTIEILDYLFPNYKMHIITNGFNEVSFRKIELSGISKYFDKIITSENAGAKKPNPQVFHYALNEAKAFPHDSIMIGDNFEADVKGALSVGMKAIHYNYLDKIVDEEVETIKYLTELKAYF
jgi:putative hydrolase of the HAD superfamily